VIQARLSRLMPSAGRGGETQVLGGRNIPVGHIRQCRSSSADQVRKPTIKPDVVKDRRAAGEESQAVDPVEDWVLHRPMKSSKRETG